MNVGMNRTTTWICFTVGVLLGRLIPWFWPISLATAWNVILGAAMVLALHWGANRRWRRAWPMYRGVSRE